MRKTLLVLLVALLANDVNAKRVKFDYSLVLVPEEGGVKFEKITDDADCVTDYDGNIVGKTQGIFGNKKTTTIDWWVIPQIGLSPDGRWLLITGSSRSEKEGIANTDIFVVRTDGTQFTQLTYHPGNDLSPMWSPDGRSIFFLSQRGSADKIYNVWRMDFNL